MKKIIIDVNISEKRVAVLEEDELVELYIEREDDKRITGNIYRGRVINVLPGMQSAFVDIGHSKNAYLYVKDALPKEVASDKKLDLKHIDIRNVVKAGQEILVQVTKEPFGTKGARVTTHISIPGRQMVLVEDTDYVGVSKKITEEEDRIRLRKLAKRYKPKHLGVILRTASKNIDEEEFKNEMNFLIDTLDHIEREKKLGIGVKTIYHELDLIHRTIRDLFTKDVEKIVVNDEMVFKSVYDLVKLLVPDLISRVELFKGTEDLFNHFKVNKMIDDSLEKRVDLESGGYLIIDETEALTSIDINTGKYIGESNLRNTVLKTNIEACKEIAKQLRLRNIGGIIIIDFIDMNIKKDEQRIIHALNQELTKDKVQAEVFGMTRLGLIEMTRKKVGSRLSERLLRDCSCCNGTGKIFSKDTVLLEIEKQMVRTKQHTTAESIIFKISESIKSYIESEKMDYIEEIKRALDMEVFFLRDETMKLDDAKIFKIGKKEFIRDILKEQ